MVVHVVPFAVLVGVAGKDQLDMVLPIAIVVWLVTVPVEVGLQIIVRGFPLALNVVVCL